MSLAARHELLEVAARHGLLVLEDSPYRLVSVGEQVPTLKSIDRKRSVVQLGSFSKTVFPGARVGYVIADQRVVAQDGRTGLLAGELAKIKSMITVNTSPLGQAVVAGAILASGGRLTKLNEATSAYYGQAMRTTLAQLDRAFPGQLREALKVRWNTPSGGFFLTLQVDFTADNEALARSADKFDVIWTPMSYFYPASGGEREIRLSVSYLSEHEIEEGIARLVQFVETETRRSER
jgi:(S)-3,5-dihydroxyphenylglycine transaminase